MEDLFIYDKLISENFFSFIIAKTVHILKSAKICKLTKFDQSVLENSEIFAKK